MSADAGLDAGETDAGETDAGETDAGPLNSDVLTLFASTDIEERVRLVWDAGTISASSISVFRDGQLIATVSGVTSYDDFDASSGSLRGFDAEATIGLPSGIELEWSVPRSEPGTRITYRVRAQFDGGELESNQAIGRRTAPSVVEWTVEAGGLLATVPASQTRWLDTSAPLPIVILGSVTATATPDDETSSVVLSADASVQRTLQPVTYTVTARPSSGPAVFATATGERGGVRPEYQWQRSTADSRDAGWVDLPYVHGRLWFDADAVFNEGRYYRVVLRAGAQESISDTPRALLWRPRALGTRGSSYIQRDDGVVLGLGLRNSRAEFEASAQFVVVNEGACVLLSDAGIECLGFGGVIRAVGFPPATQIFGGGPLCAAIVDGGLQCVDGLGNVPDFDLSELISVVASNNQLVCGERAADAGIRCVTRAGASPPFDVSPRPLGIWTPESGAAAIVSYPSGVIVLPGGGPLSLPMEDAGYVWVSANFGTCGVREDGQLRCVGNLGWSKTPPVGVELFEKFELSSQGSCGLTRGHRVRCEAVSTFRSLPPPPPVRQVRVYDDAYYLLENGLIAGRGPSGGPQVLGAGPGLLDRFSQLPGGLMSQQCALRVDQSVSCWGPMPISTPGRYSKIVHGYGVRDDGGVESWVGATDMTGAPELIDVGNTNVCGRFPDDSWTCSPVLPIPLPSRPFSMVVANPTNTCALDADGKVECWPDPAPARAQGRRYRHLGGGDHTSTTCGVTVEGEVICWRVGVAGPFPLQIPWDDFVTFEWSHAGGCGVRRDGTAPCIGVYRAPWE